MINDGSGVRAIVRADEVALGGGLTINGEVLIPDGASVQVVGNGHWIAETSDVLPAGNPRSAARMLEITGTVDEPVIIELIGTE